MNKNLLLILSLFIFSCSNLDEEKVIELKKLESDQNARVVYKLSDGKLKYKLKLEQEKNCNRYKNIKFWRLSFIDEYEFSVTSEDIYNNLDLEFENDCLAIVEGFKSISDEKFRLIEDIKIRAGVIK
tara:strand:- start:107 stop:487 length:381 start_codon:yes stop_codon:yes gene_type:complete